MAASGDRVNISRFRLVRCSFHGRGLRALLFKARMAAIRSVQEGPQTFGKETLVIGAASLFMYLSVMTFYGKIVCAETEGRIPKYQNPENPLVSLLPRGGRLVHQLRKTSGGSPGPYPCGGRTLRGR